MNIVSENLPSLACQLWQEIVSPSLKLLVHRYVVATWWLTDILGTYRYVLKHAGLWQISYWTVSQEACVVKHSYNDEFHKEVSTSQQEYWVEAERPALKKVFFYLVLKKHAVKWVTHLRAVAHTQSLKRRTCTWIQGGLSEHVNNTRWKKSDNNHKSATLNGTM